MSEFHEEIPLRLRFVEANAEEAECVYCQGPVKPSRVVAAFFKGDTLIGPVCDGCIHTFSELPFDMKY